MSSLSEGYARVDREDRAREMAEDREREGYAEQEALRECVIGGCGRPCTSLCSMYQEVPQYRQRHPPGDPFCECDECDVKVRTDKINGGAGQ